MEIGEATFSHQNWSIKKPNEANLQKVIGFCTGGSQEARRRCDDAQMPNWLSLQGWCAVGAAAQEPVPEFGREEHHGQIRQDSSSHQPRRAICCKPLGAADPRCHSWPGHKPLRHSGCRGYISEWPCYWIEPVRRTGINSGRSPPHSRLEPRCEVTGRLAGLSRRQRCAPQIFG